MDSKLTGFIKKRAFLVFLILTVLISWSPWLLGGQGLLVYGPTIAGLIVIVATKGKDGLRDIVKQAFRVRARFIWWIMALLLPCVVAFAAIAANMAMGNGLPGFEFFKDQWYLAPVFFIMTIVGGPLGEEIGWRGFSVPYLQRKTTPILTALIIGAAWGLWHIPQFFAQGTLHYQIGVVYLPLFVLGELALSVVMTWLYNKTNSSLLIAGFLFHNADNFWGVVLTTDATMDAAINGGNTAVNVNLWILSIVVYAVFAAVLAVATKGRLGYSSGENTIDAGEDVKSA